MDLLANDLGHAISINAVVGKKCCVEKLKELALPGHGDWIYIALGCSCGQWWKIWKNKNEMSTI